MLSQVCEKNETKTKTLIFSYKSVIKKKRKKKGKLDTSYAIFHNTYFEHYQIIYTVFERRYLLARVVISKTTWFWRLWKYFIEPLQHSQVRRRFTAVFMKGDLENMEENVTNEIHSFRNCIYTLPPTTT